MVPREKCPNKPCNGTLTRVDIPSVNLHRCPECGAVFRFETAEAEPVNVTHIFEQLAQGDDRVYKATSGEHQVSADSIMQLITKWRAASEMETLAFVGMVQQRLGLLDNRLHSLKKRLAESMLGEPTPLDSEEMLRLVNECIDLASPTPARSRGVPIRPSV